MYNYCKIITNQILPVVAIDCYNKSINYRIMNPQVRLQYEEALETLLKAAKLEICADFHSIAENLQRIHLSSCYANRDLFIALLEDLKKVYSFINFSFRIACVNWASLVLCEDFSNKELKKIVKCDYCPENRKIKMSLALLVLFLNSNMESKRLLSIISYFGSALKFFPYDFKQYLSLLLPVNQAIPQKIIKLLLTHKF